MRATWGTTQFCLRSNSMVAPKGNVAGADPSRYTTSYLHDAYGEVSEIRDPLWRSSSPSEHRQVFHYDADDR
jgi:hypothetical protein